VLLVWGEEKDVGQDQDLPAGIHIFSTERWHCLISSRSSTWKVDLVRIVIEMGSEVAQKQFCPYCA